jgi:hypothetical protein
MIEPFPPGDGNSNNGKPSFLEAVTEALRRQWRVRMIYKSCISSAYLKLQKQYRNSLFIQRVCRQDLDKAHIRAESSSHLRLPRAPSANPQSPAVAPVLSPPTLALSAEELRAVRLKYFRPEHRSPAADAQDTSCLDGNTDCAAPRRALCFKGETALPVSLFFNVLQPLH